MRSFIIGLAIAVAVSGLAVHTSSAATENESRAQRIARNLKQSGMLKDYRVAVKYEDGVASLSGTVTSQQQKQVAAQIARNSAGVQRVVNKLEVKNRSPEEDEGLSNLHFEVASNTQAISQQKQMAPRHRSPQAAVQRTSRNTVRRPTRSNMPVPYARTGSQAVQPASYSRQAQYAPHGPTMGGGMSPVPMGNGAPAAVGQSVSYDNPQMPSYAWPSYAASPNYAALTYPKQYSASAWPYIGPFYPYPQVPLGWRKVTLEWDDGWWFLDFKDK